MKNKYIKPKLTVKKIKQKFLFGQFHYDEYDPLNTPYQGVLLASGWNPTCFVKSTKINMADGSKKDIEKIIVSDLVESYDLKKNKVEQNIVLKLLNYPNIHRNIIILNNKLKTTPDHPIWTKDRKWIKAQHINIGDEVLTSNGKTITITKIELISGNYEVFNLILKEETHNYFAENILVHNDKT
jgi:intein/homing endonuclease